MAKFVVSRIFRLYPAFWLSVLAAALLLIIEGNPATTQQILANLTLVYPVFRQPAISGVFWTLIVELLFYLIACGLFVICSLERPVVLGFVALLGVFSAVIPMSVKAIMGVSLPLTLLGYHLSFLLLGCLIRQSFARMPHARTMALVLGASIAASLPLVSGLFTGDFGKPADYSLAHPIGAMLSVGAAVMLFLAFWLEPFRRQSLLALSLGAWSYSIYLFHEPIATIISWFVKPNSPAQAIVFVLAVSGVTIIISSFVYNLVERPSILAGRKIVSAALPKETREATP